MRFLVAIVLSILAIVGIMLMIGGVKINEINIGMTLLALIVAYLVFSYTILNPGEVGMMTIWGKPIRNLTRGWYFTPAGIVSVRKETGTIFQDELPADPEKIFRDEGKVPEGMFPPIRVKFGQTDPKDTTLVDDPYNVAMVTEVVPVVSWHVDNPTIFFDRMGNVAKCRQILADKAVELFGDKFANVTPAKAALALHTTSQELQALLEKEAEDEGWGIMIDDAYVKPFVFTHALNSAVVGVSVAREGAKATVLTAEGAAKSVNLAADAEKQRLIKTGLARTDSGGNIVELLPDANTRVLMEAIKALAGVTGTVVLGSDVTPMLNVRKEGK